MSDRVKIVDQTIYLFVLLDDIFRCLGHQTDPRARCTDSEVLTTAMVSALHFGANHADAIGFVQQTGLMPTMVEASRFNRRLHALGDLVVELFFQLGHVLKDIDTVQTYRVDSFPVKSCHNIRIRRSKLFEGEDFRGRNASKREYFYGVKVFILTNAHNIPVEYTLTPGSWADIEGLRQLPLYLPPQAVVFGDSGFTDYSHEEALAEADGIDLKVARKKNSKRPHQPWWNYLISLNRKPIETTFSELTALFGKKIHATSQRGFLLKLVLFIFAFTLDQFIN